MNQTRQLRVQARRNATGTLLRWHPDDRDEAGQLLDRPLMVIVPLFDVVDRRHVADGDIVATLRVWPRSGELEEVSINEDCHRSRARLQATRDDLHRYADGGTA